MFSCSTEKACRSARAALNPSPPDSPVASPSSMQDSELCASVTAHLQPHFNDEESLHAYLLLQPPEQRADKLAAQCGIQLGIAALYVKRFCMPPGVFSGPHIGTARGRCVSKSAPRVLLGFLPKLLQRHLAIIHTYSDRQPLSARSTNACVLSCCCWR